MKTRIPMEIIASLLAASTVILSLPPWNLPPWAVFVSWAGCFAMGGPKGENIKMLWKTMPIGSSYACLIVLIVNATSANLHLSFWGQQIDTMVAIFVLNTCLLYTAHIKKVAFVPGMFFGFSSYFATVFGGWGPVHGNPLWAWVAVIVMNAIGPAYAWLNVKLSLPRPESPDAGSGTPAAAGR